ncbi:MAG: sulfatase-like hydrolase/transferase [Candidatus Delongbacteria bacterium]|nr:sulfatase-like hydrolase/transferase [Candidatus Delongbacteria bacterium]
MWVIFFIEMGISDFGVSDNSSYYYQQLKIFISYTVLGLIIGGLSAGILAKKKKKYSYFFENDLKKYSKYFLKNFSLSLTALFSLVSREVINHPLLYKYSLLSDSFLFNGLFNFIKNEFSPLYFSIFFMIIIVMSIHNLIYNLSIYQGTKRIIGYLGAIIFSIILIFNFGFLNALEKKAEKNIILIGVENLKNYHLSDRKTNDKPALKELKSHSYDFVNCFSVAKDPRVSLLSVLTSIHPEKGEYLGGYRSYGLEGGTVFSILNKNNFRTGIFSDRKFAFNRFDEKNEYLVKYPTKNESLKAKIILSHFMMPIVFNNTYSIKVFSEALLLSEYRDKSYLKGKIAELISGSPTPFMFLYTISDYRDYLPFPYYRISESEDKDAAFLTYLNDEINEIYKVLKKYGKLDDTVICLFGLPEHTDGLGAGGFKIPFLISSKEFEIDRKVKNDYSSLDILPTVLDAAGFDIAPLNLDGISFFDPEFKKQDIILTDVSVIKNQDIMYFENNEGYISKNIAIEREVYPMVSHSIIRGDYKLNIIPSDNGITYELFDISKDYEEKDNIINLNSSVAKKMKDIYEEKMNKEFNFKTVNGYVLK